MQYLLDTNVVSAYFRAHTDDPLVAMIATHAGEVAISVTVWHELRFGWALLPPSRKKLALGSFLDSVVTPNFPILDYDRRAAEWHAKERASLRERGIAAPYADGQVAAVAYVHERIVVTDNVKDFRMYQGLSVERWPHLVQAPSGDSAGG